jgi:hypothetical protein
MNEARHPHDRFNKKHYGWQEIGPKNSGKKCREEKANQTLDNKIKLMKYSWPGQGLQEQQQSSAHALRR